MVRQRPLSLLVLGLLCTFFAALYLLWFSLHAWAPLRNLLEVAFGDPEPLPDLTRDNLIHSSAIRTVIMLGAVRLALMMILLASSIGLVLHQRWARSAAVCGAALVILLALGSTLARLWFLTPPGGAVKVTPLLLDGVAILFANVLGGTMFLPEISAAYAGYLEVGEASQPAELPTAT